MLGDSENVAVAETLGWLPNSERRGFLDGRGDVVMAASQSVTQLDTLGVCPRSREPLISISLFHFLTPSTTTQTWPTTNK